MQTHRNDQAITSVKLECREKKHTKKDSLFEDWKQKKQEKVINRSWKEKKQLPRGIKRNRNQMRI